MPQKRIIGAVAVGDKTYKAGDEAAFEAAVAAAAKTATPVDLERLSRKNVIVGYEAAATDPDVEAIPEEVVESTTTTKLRKGRRR